MKLLRKRGNCYEHSNGSYNKSEYNTFGKMTYYEDSDGHWMKHTNNQKGNLVREEYSDGNRTEYIVLEV